jgi:hypothetical protein
MDARVGAAAQNNARWCNIVCQSHGLATVLSEQLWIAPEGSPRLYPDAVTLAPGLPLEFVLSQIDTRSGCSVKDSFADLDLAEHGFTLLFDAHWFYREPAPPGTRVRRAWQQITTGDDLEQWVAAADLKDVIRPELLRDQTVRILAVRDERAVTAGAIINRTGDTVGLSNVFTTATEPASDYGDLPQAIGGYFPGVPVVGYERSSRSAGAADSGFEAIGPLRVWMKPAA